MSWFTGDDGTRYELFGAGGGEPLAEELGVPLLAQIPFVPPCGRGRTKASRRPGRPGRRGGAGFAALAARIAGLGPSRIYRRELTVT